MFFFKLTQDKNKETHLTWEMPLEELSIFEIFCCVYLFNLISLIPVLVFLKCSLHFLCLQNPWSIGFPQNIHHIHFCSHHMPILLAPQQDLDNITPGLGRTVCLNILLAMWILRTKESVFCTFSLLIKTNIFNILKNNLSFQNSLKRSIKLKSG